MPLLRNEPFVRLPVPIDLKPDEEVFFCELTSEVFRKYDDYFNRTILLNSMVWTCSVTGKSGLTYEEAAKSEKSFRKKRGKAANGNSPVKGSTAAAPADENTPTTTQSLNESLTPALEKAAALLTMLTGRGFMNDLLADLYTHLKDHYVVDDIVEFMLKDGKKKTGKIIAVEYCGKDKNGEDSIEQHRYSVEVSDGKKDKGKLFTVVYKDVIRRKSILSKTRCRNFIKTYCEVADSTIYKLKDSAKLKFNINDDQKFTSAWRRVFGVKSIQPPFPYTPLSRKPGGHSVSEQLAANCEFVAKNEQPNFDASALEKRQLVVLSLESELQRLNLWPVNQVIFTLQTEEAESAMAKLREDLKIGREMEKERIKEEKKKMLEWKKMRDDLECDDHKPFPNFPILTLPGGLTDEQFGDCISLQNFLYSFALNSNNNDDIFDQDDESLQQFEMSKKLDKKFVNSLHENFLSKLSSTSLNVNENAFLKLLQWFLAAVLEKYDEEEEEIDDENLNHIDNDAENGAKSIINDQSMNSSTLTNIDSMTGFFDPKFIFDSTAVHTDLKKTFGVSLKNLILNHRTITEILRLFLLTSGHYSNRSSAQLRGAYRCWDDFVFALRIRRPDLVERLSRENVLGLNFDDRLQILLSLRDQLMTFGSFRLFVQQRMDRMSTLKQELRQWLVYEQRWDKEARAAKIVLEQEVKKVERIGEQEDAVEQNNTKRTPEMYLLLKKYAEGGRSKRDKLKLVLWEGVDFASMTTIMEIDEVQKIQKDFLSDELSQIRNHIRTLRNLCGLLHIGRDRAYRNYWYLSQFNSILVEHCPVDDLNSICFETPTPLDKTQFDARTLLVCTGGRQLPCPVHDRTTIQNRWFLVDNLPALIETLNSRGFRESELVENIKFLQMCDENLCVDCDSALFCKEEKSNIATTSLDHINSQMAFEMRARLLELEENLHRRSLAFSRKADREKWRSDLDKSVSDNDDESLLKFMTSCLEQLASTFDAKFFVRKSAFFSTKKQESRPFEQWCRSLQCDVKNWSRLFLDLDTFENAVNWQKVAPSLSSSAKSTPKHENNNNKNRKNSLENVNNDSKNVRRSSPATPTAVAMEEIVSCAADVATVAKPPSTKRRRVRCSSASSSASSVESGEIRDNCPTATDKFVEKSQITTTTSRTGRAVKRPISFEDLMTESKKNAVANRALIVHEPASSSTSVSSSNGVSSSAVVKKLQTKSVAEARNHDLTKCQAILRFATHFPDAWPFLRPVSKIDAPDYYEVIRKPMDFQTLRENLDKNFYKNFDDFFNDLKLIFENCRAYNESHAPVYKCGEKLEKYVNQKVRDFKN